jgi:hypothetical protein
VNWDAIAAIGDLLGAFGVLASLLYLGTQIRQGWFSGWWESNSYMFPPVFKSFVQDVMARSSSEA